MIIKTDHIVRITSDAMNYKGFSVVRIRIRCSYIGDDVNDNYIIVTNYILVEI